MPVKRKLTAQMIIITIQIIILAFSRTILADSGAYGYIVDPNGNPVGGAVVTVLDSNSGVVAMTTTGPNGFFQVALLPGTYTLRVSKAGYVDKTIQFSYGKTGYPVFLGNLTLDYAVQYSLPVRNITIPILTYVSLPFTITNKGPRPEDIGIRANTNCSLTVEFLQGTTIVSKASLNPGDTLSLQMRLWAPYQKTASCTVNIYLDTTVPRTIIMQVTILNTTLGTISAQTKSITAQPGTTVTLPVKVTNTLSKTFTADLALGLPQGWTATLQDQNGNAVSTIQLDPQQSTQLLLKVYVPKDAEQASYPVQVKITGRDPYFTETLAFQVNIVAGTPNVALSLSAPHVDAYAGATAKFPFTLGNTGTADCLASFNLSGLPNGYKWQITDSQGNVVSQVYVKAGSTASLTLAVTIPPEVEPTTIPLTLSASCGSSVDKAQLSLGVMGTYKLSFVTQSFYLETVPGSTQTFQIQVQNTGYSSLTNLNLAFTSVPKGFTVNVDPVNVLVLKPGDTATFTVTITTTGDINTGDYYLTFVVKADQLPQTSRDLHVFVKPQQSMVYVALVAVLLVVGALYLVYRRFGRR
jgi:uncharacterized membrane protein